MVFVGKILRKKGERGPENLMYPYIGKGGVKNRQNHPYVIDGWSFKNHCEIQ